MNTKLLKQKILDLAIHGRLVPQNPDDEPASQLLRRISEEKETLIAQGKIKRPKKSDAPNSAQEFPFEIPDSWEWVTIGDLLINRDSERIPIASKIRDKQTNKIYDYYGAAGVIDKVDSYIFSEKLLLIGEDGANLLTRSKNNAFFAEGKYWVNNHAHVLDCSDKSVLQFVSVVINASSLEEYITGTAQPKLSQDNLNKILIPLPPLAEQQRIVSAIEKWFSLIDEIETNKESLQAAIKQTKSKVLDLAIKGKLVSQDINDELASELLKRINKEKENLINQGKIKRPKKSDAVNAIQEFPFEIPDSWEWVKLGDVIDVRDGTHDTPKYVENGYPLITSKDFDGDNFDLSKTKYITLIPKLKKNKIGKILTTKQL